MNSISNEIENSKLIYDRFLQEESVLPYALNDVCIQPNELATAVAFNKAVEKLHFNFLYLYRLCFISTFLPKDVCKGRFNESFGFIPNFLNKAYKNADFSFNTRQLSASYEALSIESNIPNTYYTLFASASAIGMFSLQRVLENLDGALFSSYTGSVKSLQSSIDPIEGSIFFKKINGMSVQDSSLYIADATYNNIYSYDASSYLSDDNIFRAILFQNNIIGGKGTVFEPAKFDNPGPIATINDNFILVVDRGNKCFKILNKDLNWCYTSLQSVFLSKYIIKKIVFHKNSKSLLVITDFHLHIFDVNNLNNIFLKNSILILNEKNFDKVIDIKLSTFDNNIFYILTSNKIFKKWIFKPYLDIGSINVANFYDTTTIALSNDWLAVSQIDNKSNLLLIKSTSITGGVMFVLEDSLNTKTLLKENTFDIFTIQDILIKKEEYNSSWVMNKSIKKLIYNHNLLTDNIIYRFFVKKDLNGESLLYTTYSQILLDNQIKNTNNFANVYINENFQSEVINRCFRLIYSYQEFILNKLTNTTPINTEMLPFKGN